MGFKNGWFHIITSASVYSITDWNLSLEMHDEFGLWLNWLFTSFTELLLQLIFTVNPHLKLKNLSLALLF